LETTRSDKKETPTMARYVVALLAINALALATLAINPWPTAAGVVSDAMDKGIPIGEGPPPPQTMPKAWGKVVGVTTDKWLVFEATDGTVRIAALGGRLMREIKRN
jgi:hypothetical protein